MSRAPFQPKQEVDFVVIGAGAAGGVLAKELAEAGLSVVLLEQGPHRKERDFKHDEFAMTFQPGLTNDLKLQPNTYRKTESDPVKVRQCVEYGRQVGGGSVHFTAN